MRTTEKRLGLDIQFAEREIIYNPAEDPWTDDLRERAHEQLSTPRLERWILTEKALGETSVFTFEIPEEADE